MKEIKQDKNNTLLYENGTVTKIIKAAHLLNVLCIYAVTSDTLYQPITKHSQTAEKLHVNIQLLKLQLKIPEKKNRY